MGNTNKNVKNAKRIIINIIITLVFAAILYYFMLPAFNIHASEMYVYLMLVFAAYALLTLIMVGGVKKDQTTAETMHALMQHSKVPAIIVLVLLAAAILGGIWSMVVFHTKAYSGLIPLENGTFATEVAEVSFDQIPMLDSASANVLADRKLGELSDLVSQFEVDDSSAQINYNDRPVRVTYLNYGDLFKWLNNRKDGLPAYVALDMVTQEVSVVRLDEGMKYSPSEYFFRNIERYLRFKYPTYMFTDVNFEIDEDGTPFWVGTVVTKTIGVFGGEDAVGAVLANASTGECTYYDVADIPQWVDRVYTANLIIQQYDYYGKYHNGFLNSFFGQSGCTVTTDGYNYIAQDDDVWLYTGITSVGGDESNVGFILVNQRTKEAKYYSVAGAEEYSAMNSAMGAVQQYNYSATFPLLLNISGQPTYFMALKDASSLVKMYAMVNVQQYQIVATGTTVAACEEQYINLLGQNNIIDDENDIVVRPVEYEKAAGIISEIRTAVLEGTTYYYIKLINGEVFYRISAAECENVVVLDVGNRVTVMYTGGEGEILTAASITSP